MITYERIKYCEYCRHNKPDKQRIDHRELCVLSWDDQAVSFIYFFKSSY